VAKPTGNPNGRPPKYKNPEELQERVDDYFKNLPTTKVVAGDDVVDVPVATITGLALHLGFCDRASFYDYENRDDFSHAIKSARLRIENDYEMQLRTARVGHAGVIFALKNLGWKDKHEQELSGPGGTALIPSVIKVGHE
jgi:hypothetical protein